MAIETEIRLLLDAVALRRVSRLAEVRAARRGRANTRRLRDIYFDTPAADLMGAGAVLRAREERGSWIQTLKWDSRASSGLYERERWEWPIAGPTLNLKALRGTGAARLFTNATVRRNLAAMFQTEFVRTSIALAFADGTCAELRLDFGEIIAGKHRAPISEIEIELLEGDHARLFDFAIGLAQTLPVRVSDASKAARGYALLPGRSPLPVKAQVPALTERMPVQDAFAEIGRSCLGQMQANEPGLSAGRNLEFLHQYRVGLRRLRSSFGLFGPVLAAESAAALVEEMRWLGACLGPARDWDVFCEQTLKPLWQRTGRNPALTALCRRCASERSACAAAAREAIGSPRYARFALRLGGLFGTPERPPNEPPLKAFAAARLQKRHRRLRKIARSLDVSDPAQIHRMRIAAKKLRYASEFFASLFREKEARNYSRSLARLQDVLGDLTDRATGLRLLNSLAPDRGKAGAFARGLVRTRCAAREEQSIRVLTRHWDDFRRQKRYWISALPMLPATTMA